MDTAEIGSDALVLGCLSLTVTEVKVSPVSMQSINLFSLSQQQAHCPDFYSQDWQPSLSVLTRTILVLRGTQNATTFLKQKLQMVCFHATKALADALAGPVDRRICISPVLLAWVAVEAPALKWNFGWKGLGHTGTDWMRVVTERSPYTSSRLLPILAFRQRRQTGPSLRPHERSGKSGAPGRPR